MKEEVLQQQLADYLRLQYPDVIFHSDFGSGTKLTMGQAVKQKRLNGGKRAWPDMFIAEPFRADTELQKDCPVFFGLFLELKKDGTRLRKKNGEWASKHIAEQAQIIKQLKDRGYYAAFVVGFDEAKGLIDTYLKGGT